MSKLSSEKRNRLNDSDFGIPEKRMYPLHDKAHIEAAVRLFGKAEDKYKRLLALNILARAREYNMDTSGWKQILSFAQEQVPPMSDGTSLGNAPPRMMAPYYDEQDELLQRVNSLDPNSKETMFDKAKRIVTSLDIPYMRDNGMLAPGDDDDPRFRRVPVPSEEGTKYMKQDPELSQYWEELNKAATGEFLIDRETGEPIGHVFVHTNEKDKGFIFNLEVNPKYRRQGYGWILTDDAVRRLGGEDLTVDADNTPAVNLYLQYGFTIYKKGQWHYDPPKDELWMKYDRSKLKQESFMDEYAKRVNDKGDPVPEKCKCGGKVSAYLRGEPVYLCEKCGKYYGTLPCNIQEGFKDSIKKIGSAIKKSMTDYMTPEKPKAELKPYDGKIPYQVYVIGNTNNDVLCVYKTKRDAFMDYARQKVTKTVRQDTGLKDLYIRFERISDYYIPHSIEGVTYVSKNDAESISYDIDHVDIDGYCTTINTVNIPKEHIKTGGGSWLCIVNEPELDIADEQYFKCRFNVKIKTYDCGEYDLDRERYTEMFTQEGAFQDLKNGVNPYSDNMVFHVTPDKHVDGQIWKPRVPDYLDPYNPEDTGFEDNTTPRICFSSSIEGCLNGITVNLPRHNPDQFDKLYVYIPEKPWKEYKHKTNKELVKEKLVYDANVTREVWIMEPVRMKLYGVIRVDQVSNVKKKSAVPTANGVKDTRNYFTYKWHWVVKPKVLAKGTKFDYSPENVIADLCIDLKKFKYGLIREGKLQTGDVSEADYNKYWVFHSGQEVDEAGGGNCWDMVEYEAGYLEAFGVPYKKYFMNFTTTKNKLVNTHTICVVPLNGKFIYIEQAFKRITDEWGHERQKTFDKLNDIFDYVAEVSAEYDNQDLNFGVWDYTNEKIDYGTPANEFQNWILTKCKMIYDGEATKSKPIKEGFEMHSDDDYFEEADLFITLGESMFYVSEYHNALFDDPDAHEEAICEFGILLDSYDDEIVQEAAYGPYDEYLKRHNYDPKTNSIEDPNNPGRRVNAGRIGSNKERNRMNKFLRENGYDPKTETILTDINDKKNPGQKKRAKFGINSAIGNAGGDMTMPPAYSRFDNADDYTDDTGPGIAMSKSTMQQKPGQSNYILKHEEGHMAYEDSFDKKRNGTWNTNPSHHSPKAYRDDINAARQHVKSQAKKNPALLGNAHDILPTEYQADKYGEEHNRYGHGHGAAALSNIIGKLKKFDPSTYRAQRDAILNSYGTGEEGFKKFAATLQDEYNMMLSMSETLKGTPSAGVYKRGLIGIKREIDAGFPESRKVFFSLTQPDEKKAIDEGIQRDIDKVDAGTDSRVAFMKKYADKAKVQQAATAAKQRQLAKEQLKQQIASGKLTSDQAAKAERKIQRIEAFEKQQAQNQSMPKAKVVKPQTTNTTPSPTSTSSSDKPLSVQNQSLTTPPKQEQKPTIKKEGYTLNRDKESPFVQEQTVAGWNAYDEGVYPVEMPDEPTANQKLLLEIVHHNIDLIVWLTEKVIVPYCKEHGLEQKATDTALRLMSDRDTDIHDWMNNLDHPSYGWGWVYPAVKGTVDSDSSATITFDSTCEHALSTSKNYVKRPDDYVQFVFKFDLADDGQLTGQMITPEKSESIDCGKYDIGSIRDYNDEKENDANIDKQLRQRLRDQIPNEIISFTTNLAKEERKIRRTTRLYKFKKDVFERVKSKYIDRNEIWFVSDVVEFAMSDIKSNVIYQKHEKLEMSKIDDYIRDLKSVVFANVGSMGDMYLAYNITNGSIIEQWDGQQIANTWEQFISMIESASEPTVKKEGYTLNRFKSRFFQEEEEVLSDTEDMEDITIGDLNLDDETTASDDKLDSDDFDENGKAYDDENGYDSDDDSENMEDPMEVPGYLKDRMSEEDAAAYEQPDENINADNVELGSFGKDTSDVQNDYDPKEIETLMKLMASEADAMNEYMDGAKETNIDVLRRLYADIANEERFHMEQLLFAKSELTGEKYVPKDPEVKDEYEELLKMGMDEETAMQTAVDRCHIRGSISNDDGERTIEIQQDVETMEMAINMFNAQFDNIMMMMESDQFKREDLNHAIDVFTEACYVQEEVYNTKMDNKNGGYLNQNKKSGPVDLLKRAIGFLLRLLGQLISKFGEFLRRTRNRSNAIRNYVKRYGPSALFASSKETLKMYFVDIDAPACINDATETFLSLVSDTFNATTRMIGSNFSLDTSRYNRDPRFNIGGNVEKGIQILSGVQLVKTKMLIPQDESKQEAIAACLFGYNFTQKAQDGSSYNTLNRLKVYTDKWSVVMNAVSKQLDVLNTLHTQQGSIYYRNRKKYDLAIKSFETIIKTCKAVVTALQSDINALMKLNNEAMNISIKKTEEKDQNDMNAYPELKQMNDQYKQSVDKGLKK